jgi:hypothetical protein
MPEVRIRTEYELELVLRCLKAHQTRLDEEIKKQKNLTPAALLVEAANTLKLILKVEGLESE